MKTVLITGGSSGIGFEMSKHWALEGYRLLWVSLLADELTIAKGKLEQEISGVKIHTLTKDLSGNNAPQEVFEWANSIGKLDVVINNAGFGTYGYVQNIDIEKELAMINLNTLCVYKMTRLFLEDMMNRNRGTIINICSNSAFQPVPRMNTYASTKAFVFHFSRGLQEELKIQKSKVKVIAVCPSAIKDTPFKKDFENVRTFQGLATTTSKEVAADVWKGFKNGKSLVVTGAKMRFLYAIRNLLPYSFQQYLVRKETENI